MTIVQKIQRRIQRNLKKLRYQLSPYDLKYVNIEREVFAKLGTTVLDGSFTGMQMVISTTMNGVPRLLGMYEHALRDTIEYVINKKYATILNVGSAEGYYAVGLALRVPDATIYAYDLDPVRLQHCANAAKINDVHDRIMTKPECTFDEFQNVITPNTLIFMDCEGCELTLLDPEKAPALTEADILVEVHDFVNPIISETLKQRFADTHQLTIIEDTAGVTDHEALQFLSSDKRKIISTEIRPAGMRWFLLEVKQSQ